MARPVAGEPFGERELAVVRRAFARQMLVAAAVADNARLEAAFASVRREAFLGDEPWQVADLRAGYRTLPANDPVLAYQDVLFALAPGRGVHNGSPSLHAAWLHALAPAPGDEVVHLGAGTGYYSALLSRLVGPEGRVTAVELDAALAGRARANLAAFTNVVVTEGDAVDWPRQTVDAVYVNFGTMRPAAAWLEHLAPGGRLVLPLAVPAPAPGGAFQRSRHGAGLLVIRTGEGFSARSLGPAYFVFAEGPLAGDDADRQALGAAFERGGIEFVRSLVWRRPVDPARCWHVGAGWGLSYDPPGRPATPAGAAGPGRAGPGRS
ncbi:protein-L-isoaspartate(D-aspartate) O-methyltransferase [Tistlia consotensis]|uniref:Protein-L-isoaspartate O-methyltransferase n=1 Tax=Tistlia consotensis USBA 355 TaxID=560819 RepID=A0A1Y6CIV7_9PROT|nr:methyltransferase domain-containing protein [Tistlia consotensis]SMF64782.1 protein-L-isoaspartate(D-aspartate) O-methyltransferase [Tistlia consotensis USBA 355]SNR96584.1 protein-L-isoaspartate(D-aspartate) O-methyltransferase [Tistlia consotensis]